MMRIKLPVIRICSNIVKWTGQLSIGIFFLNHRHGLDKQHNRLTKFRQCSTQSQVEHYEPFQTSLSNILSLLNLADIHSCITNTLTKQF